jgi:diadenosine tetraphosphate (Ap4A) HIT family hydrolase
MIGPTTSASNCKACAGHWPPADHRIADCGLTVAYLFEDQFFPGWTVLVLKRHATELFELSREERGQLIEEVNIVARVLAEVFKPVKINYGVLGNQLPHIHWHVVPRLADDPAPLEAVWGHKHEPKRLAGEKLRETIARIREQLNLSM